MSGDVILMAVGWWLKTFITKQNKRVFFGKLLSFAVGDVSQN
jgi:hypothetical protein